MKWRKTDNGKYISDPPHFEIIKTEEKTLPWQLVDKQMYRGVWKYCERNMQACKRLAERLDHNELW